jgi:nicotinate-nucleotide adenylyltransferase
VKKIGLFGGTFDPVHIGHLLLANTVLGEAGLDSVLFVPAAVPPHKPGGARSDPEDRLRMVRLAIDGHGGFDSTDLELRRPGASYSVDTLVELQASNGPEGVEWFLILGADMWVDLPNWKNPDEIIRRAGLLVMERPGTDARGMEKRFLEKAVFVKTPKIGISSTEIRNRVRAGKSIRYWVPRAVEEFILEKGLYRQ